MAEYGRITGQRLDKNKGGAQNVRLLQVEVTDADDVQTVQLFSPGGEEFHPPTNSKVVIISIGDAWKIAFAIDDGIVPSMAAGAKKLYSIASGAVSAWINLLTDGTIEINGNADNAIAFTDMQTAFDTLRTELNAAINIINTHTHLYTPGAGTPTQTAATGTPSTPAVADMSGAKVDEVKLP